MNIAACLTSKSDEHYTPEAVLSRVKQVGPIVIDPCWSPASLVKAKITHDGITSDGLKADWCEEPGLVFVNAPYSEIGPWISRCAADGIYTDVIALLPARVDTRWFADVWRAQAICFWKGRLTFGAAKSPAPFPSVVALWSPSDVTKYKFAAAFADAGKIIFP